MENQRHFLTIALIAISAVLYFKWVEFVAQKEAAVTEISTPVVEQNGVPTAPAYQAEPTTVPSGSPSTTQASSGQVPSVPTLQSQPDTSSFITVETDMVIARINPVGGVIERLEIRQEPVSLEQKDQGFPLLQNNASEKFVTQDGLASNNPERTANHQTLYQSSGNNYQLGDRDQVVVPLTWASDDGLQITKTLTFKRDSYVVDIDYTVENNSSTKWDGLLYAQFNRTQPESKGGGFGQLPSYTGAATYTEEERFNKVDFDDIEDLQKTVVNGRNGLQLSTDKGWIAMLQHYFVGAWLPQPGNIDFYSNYSARDQLYYIGYKESTPKPVAAGETGTFSTRVYLGSKEQSRLKRLEEEGFSRLSRTVDYGMLTFIADPLFVVLSWLHNLVGNWGWAIILLTILIKILFYPLSAASYRSMGKMRKLQPRLQTLKERYKDDRQKFQMEMMELYKKEKVNPAGGCLPILIQIPVFIALYWVLLESVEMRQAPFALWWQDLSAKDPYYVLPVLMGISMYLMQKLNPAPMDDIQKKVFMIMPFALTFLFMTFPQGLVLYWVVNNILTMIQQWFNYRQQEKSS